MEEKVITTEKQFGYKCLPDQHQYEIIPKSGKRTAIPRWECKWCGKKVRSS